MSIFKKFRNNHFLSFAGNAVVAVMGITIYSLLAHKLQTEADLGNWVFFVVTLALADTFRTGFLQNSLIKFYAGTSDERAANIAGSAWHIGFYITMLVCLINLVCYFFYNATDNPGMYTVIYWFGITFLSMLPLSVALWILQAEERFGIMLYIRVINQGLFFILILAAIFFNKLSLEATVYSHLISCVITSAVALVLGWARLKTVSKRTFESMRELFHYGKYSVGTSLASQSLKSSDVYVIKAMMGSASAAAIGIYNIPQRLMEMIEIPLRSFTSTAMPMLSAASNRGEDDQVAYIMKKFAGMLTLALFPICVVGFIGANIIIGIIGGKKFVDGEAVTVFRIFMCFAMLLPVDRFLGITLDMINKPRLNMFKVFIMLGVNVAADVAGLLIFHSIYGVALASIITFLTGTLYGYFCLKRYLKFTMRDIFVLGYAELKDLLNNIINKKLRTNKGQ